MSALFVFLVAYAAIVCWRVDQVRRRRAGKGNRGKPWKWGGGGWR